jgi:hypothetical protein
LILITGQGDDKTDFQNMGCDSDGFNYLAKPFTAPTFLGAIKKVISKSKDLASKL